MGSLLTAVVLLLLLTTIASAEKRTYIETQPQDPTNQPSEESSALDCVYIWPPAGDTILWAGNPDGNYGSLNLLWVGESDYRSIVRWTLTALPSRFMITDAVAHFALVNFLVEDPMQVATYALLQSWTEDGATWNSRDGTNSWSTPGGTHLALGEDEVEVTDLEWPHLYSWNLTDLVTEWYNGHRPNYGILLKSSGYPNLWVKQFGSKEHPGWKPQLDVCYIVGPLTLTGYEPITRGIPSPDWYQLTRGNFWNIVAVRPESGDYDLRLYSDPGYSTLLNSSTYGGNAIDYVVIDGNHAPSGLYYPQVYQFSGRGNYQVQTGSSTMDIVSPGVFGPFLFSDQDVARIWDATLLAGSQYFFGAHAPSGDAVLGLALHKSAQDTPSSYYQGRYQAIAQSVSDGSGKPVFLTHSSTESDRYGLLATNREAELETTYYLYMDTTPPVGSISIEASSIYTNSPDVTLSLDAEDLHTGIYAMRFSNSGSPDGEWQDFSSTDSWTLEGGDGEKTVFAQFRNFAGMSSEVYSATITLDTTPPSASVSCITEAETNSFPVDWSGEDGLSGVASFEVEFQAGEGEWTSWLSDTSTTSEIFGPDDPLNVNFDQTYSFRARAKDYAGNLGEYSATCNTYVLSRAIYLPFVVRP